jgi:Protein of unknown function (DUF4232)
VPHGGSTTLAGRSSTTSTSGSAPATSTAATPRCPTAGLAGSLAGRAGAAGTIEVTVELANHSTSTCVLVGYPGLRLLGIGGGALPTNVVRKGTYPFTAMAPATVTLPPEGTANFNIGYSDVPAGGETSCPMSASLEVTPPDATDHLVVAAALTPCAGGTMVVSPVFAAGGPGSASTAPASG